MSAITNVIMQQMIAAKNPQKILSEAKYTIAPINAKCQQFQRSILTVRVVLVSSINRFTPRQTGIMKAPTEVLQATAAAEGHPMSKIPSSNPQISTILLNAGPRLLVNKAVTTDKPTKPTPTNKPLLSALGSLIPIHTPKIVKMIGIITAAPRPIMYLNTSSILFYFFSVFNDKLLCFPRGYQL